MAGQQSYQKGSVLFVNLPLGYLKGSTDGLLLHAFLRYFASHALSLPYLMSVPDGVGGLVLNWHIDSNAAIKPLQEMSSWTLLQQGPYSIHITAGPDAGKFGDRKGFDVDHNPVSQDLIRKYMGLGYEIGSHGGWIHDYFSAHVETDNPKDLEQFLALNKNSLERVSGKPVGEYSAPNGNQPPWVTHWLEAHGFVAYYFTGDTGMGPTQGYRNGEREARNVWAFPILHLDRAAGFEEMSTEGYSSSEIDALACRHHGLYGRSPLGKAGVFPSSGNSAIPRSGGSVDGANRPAESRRTISLVHDDGTRQLFEFPQAGEMEDVRQRWPDHGRSDSSSDP